MTRDVDRSSTMDAGNSAAILRADAQGIAEAASLWARGELVAFPSETVYGLGADAADPDAVARIFAAKGRPSNHPLIVHLPPGGDPLWWASELSSDAQALIDAFWPGPLTLIVGRAARIPDAVSGGQDSIGLRCPSHPVAQALFDAFAALRGGHGGIAGPSANRFGKVSPTAAQHVIDEFSGCVPVVDGGESVVGIESTIIDLSRGFPALLRPGHIRPEQIAEVLGRMPLLPGEQPAAFSAAPAPRAAGTLRAHYAPTTPLCLMSLVQIANAVRTRLPGVRDAVVVRAPRTAAESLPKALRDARDVEWVHAPADPDGYARVLYGMLRSLDQGRVDRILVEALPADAAWQAVADRLERAAAAFEPTSSSTEH